MIDYRNKLKKYIEVTMKQLTLNNGVKIPIFGFGTYEISPDQTKQAVLSAFEDGYRLIDTAQYYQNEQQVGEAVKASGLNRDEVFITTKTMTDGYEDTKIGLDESLRRSGLDYFDLVLIHWPMGHDIDTWHALEVAYQAGKARAIGISNFNSRQTLDLIHQSSVRPMVDQIETHLLLQQWKMHEFLEKENIVHESYSPLGNGQQNLTSNPVLKEIGEKYGKSPIQVILRYLVQNNVVTIPRSTNPAHIKANIDIFDFELNSDDLKRLRVLDERKPIDGWPAEMREDEDY